MELKIISWDIYEIQSEKTPLRGVKLRGRIRRFCLEKGRNVLVENAQDHELAVRFAVPSGEDVSSIKNYLKKIVPDASIELVKTSTQNPVLSKLKVNIKDRYVL